MTLVDLLKNKNLSSELSRITFFPKLLKREIVVPPISKHYTLIGTAFDYLLRFYVERNNRVVNKNWASEQVPELTKFQPDLKKTVDEIIAQARKNHNDYIKTGRLTDSILNSVLLLAKLDGIHRTGGALPYSFDTEKDDFEDLKRLYSVIPKNLFVQNKICFLNPTFGTASLMVGGADADLVIGDQLIDIKTTSNFGFTKDYFLQLTGYYILNEIGGIDGAKKKIKINKLGIYYSRHAFLFSFKITDVFEESELKHFMELFIDVAQGFV